LDGLEEQKERLAAAVTENKVQRLSDNKLVDLKELKLGDEFIRDKKVWQVTAVKANGVECVQDQRFFMWDKI
jgi:hypothetical protein